MKKSIALLPIFIFCLAKAEAQTSIYNGVSGIPVEGKKSKDNPIGSKFLSENWTTGDVLQEDDKYFNGMNLKYNLYDDQLIFKNQKDEILAFKTPIKEFHLYEDVDDKTRAVRVYKNGFPEVDKYTKKNYYQVLVDGKAILLKKFYLSFVEGIPYGASDVQKTLIPNQAYYLFANGKMTKVKKQKDSFLLPISNQKEALNLYIKNEKIKFKSDEDLIKVLSYYNTLN